MQIKELQKIIKIIIDDRKEYINIPNQRDSILDLANVYQELEKLDGGKEIKEVIKTYQEKLRIWNNELKTEIKTDAHYINTISHIISLNKLIAKLVEYEELFKDKEVKNV